MTVKSSDVLRLAAEFEFLGNPDGRIDAMMWLDADDEVMKRERRNVRLVGWLSTPPCTEHAVMALCLAAAIAEYEGD